MYYHTQNYGNRAPKHIKCTEKYRTQDYSKSNKAKVKYVNHKVTLLTIEVILGLHESRRKTPSQENYGSTDTVTNVCEYIHHEVYSCRINLQIYP